ncbi:MAG: hypothetical protein QXP88_02220, partial [Thermoproteota archaeon]
MVKSLEILEVSRLILSKYSLCDRCLGRQFHLLNEKTDNEEIGHSIKFILRTLAKSGFKQSKVTLESLGVKNFYEEKCYVCNNLIFPNLDTFFRLMESQISDVEFNTFQVTSFIPKEIIRKDDSIKIEFGISTGENIKTEFNRLLSNLIEEKTKKKHVMISPDVTLLFDS